jgi:hypothetical protein
VDLESRRRKERGMCRLYMFTDIPGLDTSHLGEYSILLPAMMADTDGCRGTAERVLELVQKALGSGCSKL